MRRADKGNVNRKLCASTEPGRRIGLGVPVRVGLRSEEQPCAPVPGGPKVRQGHQARSAGPGQGRR